MIDASKKGDRRRDVTANSNFHLDPMFYHSPFSSWTSSSSARCKTHRGPTTARYNNATRRRMSIYSVQLRKRNENSSRAACSRENERWGKAGTRALPEQIQHQNLRLIRNYSSGRIHRRSMPKRVQISPTPFLRQEGVGFYPSHCPKYQSKG